MTVPFRPIMSALLRNRTGALLVAFQISIALAVLVNAVYIVKQRVDRIGRPTGMDVANIFVISSSGFAQDFDYPASVEQDLDYFRRTPGIVAGTPTNGVPLSGGGSSTVLSVTPKLPKVMTPYNYFDVDENGAEALGLRMLAGRWFNKDEVAPAPKTLTDVFQPNIIMTKALADKLFPNGDALGKTVYDFQQRPAVIIGIVERMLGSWISRDDSDLVFYQPRKTYGPNVRYLVRTAPGQRDAMMRKVESEMAEYNRSRAIDSVRPLQEYMNRTYLSDRNMGIFLVTTTALLLAITSLGIFGLATFNVSTRTKQIGTRRAVGARRGDIVRYFLVENWMISTAGVAIGCILALAAGYWLSLEYEFPRVDLYYLILGVLALWTIGVAAAWQPARRAANISPAIATRNI
jgi:putative ABC transport system permease protein